MAGKNVLSRKVPEGEISLGWRFYSPNPFDPDERLWDEERRPERGEFVYEISVYYDDGFTPKTFMFANRKRARQFYRRLIDKANKGSVFDI